MNAKDSSAPSGELDSKAAPFANRARREGQPQDQVLEKPDSKAAPPAPLGTLLKTKPIRVDTTIETFVSGIRKQGGRAAEMMFSVDAIIRCIAWITMLEPGDLIATGAPAGIVPVAAGEVEEVSAGGIGTLRDPVIRSAGYLEA